MLIEKGKRHVLSFGLVAVTAFVAGNACRTPLEGVETMQADLSSSRDSWTQNSDLKSCANFVDPKFGLLNSQTCTIGSFCLDFSTCQFGVCCSGVLDPETCYCRCNGGDPCVGEKGSCCRQGPDDTLACREIDECALP